MSSEQEPAQVNTPKDSEVKYILSGQPTGWWAAAKDVREFDVEKVSSCKEDIDTLLVFAGLFSAVLSAFLVAVYPNLQQQPSDRIVYAIERVATQTAGYRVNLTDGTLIAANIPPPSPPSFQVSDEDIRVNVLWFASLIISLVTASFGMLVKQWLREFLASEDPSALHRLRLRHFREPQMKAWMVYEIAGLLPILLHLSLGLFFVGLCYFTTSVHSSIGYTTVPLVIGWALCFFAATVLPIFFPRCPYKVASLKVLIVRIHRLVRSCAKRIYPRTDEEDCEDSSNEDEDAGQFFVAAIRQVTAIWVKCCQYTKSPTQAVVTTMQDMKGLFTAAIKAVRDIPDESILVESPKYDLDILSSVDAIQGNDEMLATIIPEALLYTRPDPADVVQLVIELLEHRLPILDSSQRSVEYWPFYDMAPLDHLRPQARDYILSILLGHIKDLDVYKRCDCFSSTSQSPGQICHDHTAVFRALFLGASAPRESSPPNVVKFLEHCFEVAYYRPGFWRWLCYDPATTDHDASQKLIRVLVVINLVNDLTITGQLQLSLEHRVAFSTQIPHPYFLNLVDDSSSHSVWRRYEHIDFTAFPWDTWQLADSYGDVDLKLSCMVFWLHTASEGLNSLQYETSGDLPPLVASVVGFSVRQFHSCWTGSPSHIRTVALHTCRELVYDGFRRVARIAVKRKDTALVFTSALLDEFQPPPHFEYSLRLFDRSLLSHMLDSSYNRHGGNFKFTDFVHSALHSPPTTFTVDQPIQPSQQDPAAIKVIFQLVMSKIATYQEPEPDITFHLRLFQVLAFFLITIYVPPDLRKECRGMFACLATSLPVPYPQKSSDTRDRLQMLTSDCLEIMHHEDRGFGKLDCPRSEEDSIFPDTFLEILLTLTGERGHSYLPRTPKTQLTTEPGPTSAVITDSVSTSNQAFNASDLVQSTSGGEPQPAYAMPDVEQTKEAHEEEEEEEEENDD